MYVCLLIKLSMEVLFIFGRGMYEHLNQKTGSTYRKSYFIDILLRYEFKYYIRGRRKRGDGGHVSQSIYQRGRPPEVSMFECFFFLDTYYNLTFFILQFTPNLNSKRNLNSTEGGFGCLNQPPPPQSKPYGDALA